MRAGRRTGLALLALLLALGAVRAALPIWIRDYVDGVLDRAEGYGGSVADVDLSLLRGAYRIEGVVIEKESGGVAYPLFTAPEVDLSIEWRALFHGALVGEVHMREPVLHFVAGPSEGSTQTGEESDWGERLEALFPIRINRLEVVQGTVHLRAPHRDPPVDVALRRLRLVARNWTNVRDREARRPARADAEGRILDGTLRARLAADPLAAHPDFTLDLALEGADLTRLNDFLRAYAGLDVQRGRLALYAEVQAEGGRFDGYVKPLVRDLDVLRTDEEGDVQSPLATAWEAVVGLLSEGLENQPEDQLGSRIALSGRFDAADVALLPALASLLRNGFVEALEPRLDELAKGAKGARGAKDEG